MIPDRVQHDVHFNILHTFHSFNKQQINWHDVFYLYKLMRTILLKEVKMCKLI